MKIRIGFQKSLFWWNYTSYKENLVEDCSAGGIQFQRKIELSSYWLDICRWAVLLWIERELPLSADMEIL